MRTDKLHRKYRLGIEILSPVHIGCGEDLLAGFDYLIRDEQFVRIDHNRLFKAAIVARIGGPEREAEMTIAEKSQAVQELSEKTLEEMLDIVPPEIRTTASEHPDGVYQYIIPTDLTAAPVEQYPVREQLKGVWGEVYLPGSSVKGMVRTLLLWAHFDSVGFNLAAEQRENRKGQPYTSIEWWYGSRAVSQHKKPLGWGREKPAKPLEKHYFGGTSFFDIMRAVRIADSSTRQAMECLYVATVEAFPGKTVHVEAICPQTTFSTEVAVHLYGFTNEQQQDMSSDERKRSRHWNKRFLDTLAQLPTIGNRYSKARLATEEAYWKAFDRPSGLNPFYEKLRERIEAGEWIMQLGWGAGWDSKTLGNLIRDQGPETFAAVVKKYGLSKKRINPGDTFPATRKLEMRDDQAVSTMGWVRLTWDEI